MPNFSVASGGQPEAFDGWHFFFKRNFFSFTNANNYEILLA